MLPASRAQRCLCNLKIGPRNPPPCRQKKESYLKKKGIEGLQIFQQVPQRGGRVPHGHLLPTRKWASKRRNISSIISYKLLNVNFYYLQKPGLDKLRGKSSRTEILLHPPRAPHSHDFYQPGWFPNYRRERIVSTILFNHLPLIDISQLLGSPNYISL